jgi:hypothetical protein
MCYFLGLMARIPGSLLELTVLVAVATTVAMRWKNALCPFCKSPAASSPDRILTGLLAGALSLMVLLDVLAFAMTVMRAPNGNWDATAIWNLRARFFYRGADAGWRDGFTETLAWSHADYPLLLPAFIASTWKRIGHESQAVPIAVAFWFCFGSAALMVCSLSILRGVRQGLVAGLTLAATPIIYAQGAVQCADVPVAFFRLATLGAIAVADHFDSAGFAVLAGMSAALDGWAKNEGLMWFGAFLLARIIVARSRLLPEFLSGAAPVLATVLLFKACVASSSDIFGPAGRIGMVDRLLTPARYGLIARESLGHIWSFGPLLISPFVIMVAYLVLTGVRSDGRDRVTLRSGALALVLTAAGYCMIYALRSLDLSWLLDSSLDRLLVQLWPGIVFLVFLAAKTLEREPVAIGLENRIDTQRLGRSILTGDELDLSTSPDTVLHHAEAPLPHEGL